MSSQDWRQEMSNLLANVESQVKLSLDNIKHSRSLFNEEFKKYFLRSLNDRVSAIYTMFETEVQLDLGSTADQNINSLKNEVETKAPSNVNGSNVTESVLIDDSDDEGTDDSQSNMDSRSVPDNNVDNSRDHRYYTRLSRNENATKKAANRSVEGDSVQPGNHGKANDMDTEASDSSAIGDENTSEVESNVEMESEQSSDDDEEISTTSRNDSSNGVNCPIKGCYKKYKTEAATYAHVKLVHGFQQPNGKFGVVRFVCKLCKYMSPYKYNFNVHFERKHPKEDLKKNMIEKFVKMPPLQYK